MTFENLRQALELGLPTFLILVGVGWLILEGWPYWKERDTENRKRHHERDMNDIASRNVQSEALTMLAGAVQTCPLKQNIDNIPHSG